MEISYTRHNKTTGESEANTCNLDEAPDDLRIMWYQGICSKREVERIMNPQNGKDYLLKLRVESILEDTRIWRMFIHLFRNTNSRVWNVTKYFNDSYYDVVMEALKPEDQKKVSKVISGTIFTNDANGLIFTSPFGPISTYSHYLKYFSYFSTLSLYNFGGKVPNSVQGAALRIAIRIMLNTEALDFSMDPRGIIPKDIQKIISTPYPYQATFLAGHEYGHFLLGHLDNSVKMMKSIKKPLFEDETDCRKYQTYNISQKHEFEADLASMNRPKYPEYFYEPYYHYTLFWFATLAIYEAAEDYIFPPDPYSSTHPSAKARYLNIIENARKPKMYNKKLYEKELPNLIECLSEQVINDVAENYDNYRVYGSVYLSAPNTEWRGAEKIDRLDY